MVVFCSLKSFGCIQKRKFLVSFTKRKQWKFSFYSEENVYFKSNEMFYLAPN